VWAFHQNLKGRGGFLLAPRPSLLFGEIIMKKTITSCAKEALSLLFQGNGRFLKRLDSANGYDPSIARPLKLVTGDQTPFCAILSCSDSRVPPELIFDQGIGDLFVIRTAGNYASTPALASLEYAVLKLKIPLIVVLGHSCCGAMQATLDKESTGLELPSDSLNALADALASSARGAIKSNQSEVTNSDLVDYATRLHVEDTIHNLMNSPALQKAQKKNEVGIIGAFYNLNTGEVEFS
jgi:carbonic anhydrase